MTTNTTKPADSQAAAMTIDSDEFLRLATTYCTAPGIQMTHAYHAMVDYIDAKIAKAEARATALEAQLADARAQALSDAMRICDEIGQDYRDQYKGRGKYAPDNPRRADSYADGCSDGAWECEGAIRAKLFAPQAQDDTSGLPG